MNIKVAIGQILRERAEILQTYAENITKYDAMLSSEFSSLMPFAWKVECATDRINNKKHAIENAEKMREIRLEYRYFESV